MIYIIQAENGYIKIGSAHCPQHRFGTLQFASPLQLRLIAILPGDARDERKLHKQFEESRRHNEWFAPNGDVLQFVSRNWGVGLDRVEDWITDYAALRMTKKQRAAELRRQAHQRNWADASFRLNRRILRKLHAAWRRGETATYDEIAASMEAAQ